MIRVLLVDDQPLNSFIDLARIKYDIEIHQCYNLETAKKEFDKKDYKAVILDCYCSKDESNEEHIDFLKEAICNINDRLPWYILSGGTAKGNFPLIIKLLPSKGEQPWKQWDPENEKGYYSKTGGDVELNTLLRRIVELDSERNEILTHYERYISIIERRCAEHSKDIIDNLIWILKPIYYNRLDEVDDKNMGLPIRTCLEEFLNSCIKTGTMPHSSDEVPNLTYDKIRCFLGKEYGSTETNSDGQKITKTVESISVRKIPNFIGEILHQMRRIGNHYAGHGKQNDENPVQERARFCGDYWKNQLTSCCFNFFDLLLWYDSKFDELIKSAEQCRIQRMYRETPKSSTPTVQTNDDENSTHSSIQYDIESGKDDIEKFENLSQKESQQTFVENIAVEKTVVHQDEGQGNGDVVNNENEGQKEEPYIVKHFQKRYKYCLYKGRRAVFQKGALVEVGDKILLSNAPKENTDPNTWMRERFPLYIPLETFEIL